MRIPTLAVGLGLVVAAAANAAESPVGDFSLADYRGKTYALADFKDKPVLVLAVVGTECPLAKLYAPRLAELARQYEPKGVAFVGLDPNSQDGVTQIAAYARQHGIHFPILKDLNNQVADRLGARRTPEVFVLDRQRVVRYRGRIDDQYAIGVQRDKPRDRDLARALDELLAGKPVSKPTTDVTGCLIGRAKQPAADGPVTFAKDIATLFNRHCVECHRPGEIGPFPLTDAAKAAGWADMIAEVVEDGRMPPWHADPKYGHFVNDRRLTAAEKKLIRTWVDAGAPAGDLSQLPPTPTFTEGWQLPKAPDKVIAMRPTPFAVPAEGAVRYQYFVADTGFTEDKWVSAVEVRPGNRAVVHHILVLARTDPRKDNSGDGGGARGYLGAYVPGLRPLAYPPGMAKRIPAKTKLVFQIHYTPNGSPQTDRSEIGFVFADPKAVTHEVRTTSAVTRRLAIPPGAADYTIDATSRPVPEGTQLLTLMPHMHLRGSAYKYEAVYPNGKRETLMDVPRYDFNWQTAYRLAEPKPLPAGTTIHGTAHFDNSANNLNNPDPTKLVRWGEQTWDEMMIGYFDVAVPKGTPVVVEPEERPPLPPGGMPIPDRFKAFLGRFDTDGDGKLSEAEIEKMPPDLRERVYEYIRQMP